MGIMSKTAKLIAYFLNNRPLCFLSTVFGARDVLVGLALVFPSDYRNTVLYANLNELGGAAVYGLALAFVALIVAVSALSDHPRLTQWGLRILSWFWLFAAISYGLTGHYVFAMANLLICCIPAGYISFYYKWTTIWDYPKREWRLKNGLEHHVKA